MSGQRVVDNQVLTEELESLDEQQQGTVLAVRISLDPAMGQHLEAPVDYIEDMFAKMVHLYLLPTPGLTNQLSHELQALIQTIIDGLVEKAFDDVNPQQDQIIQQMLQSSELQELEKNLYSAALAMKEASAQLQQGTLGTWPQFVEFFHKVNRGGSVFAAVEPDTMHRFLNAFSQFFRLGKKYLAKKDIALLQTDTSPPNLSTCDGRETIARQLRPLFYAVVQTGLMPNDGSYFADIGSILYSGKPDTEIFQRIIEYCWAIHNAIVERTQSTAFFDDGMPIRVANSPVATEISHRAYRLRKYLEKISPNSVSSRPRAFSRTGRAKQSSVIGRRDRVVEAKKFSQYDSLPFTVALTAPRKVAQATTQSSNGLPASEQQVRAALQQFQAYEAYLALPMKMRNISVAIVASTGSIDLKNLEYYLQKAKAALELKKAWLQHSSSSSSFNPMLSADTPFGSASLFGLGVRVSNQKLRTVQQRLTQLEEAVTAYKQGSSTAKPSISLEDFNGQLYRWLHAHGDKSNKTPVTYENYLDEYATIQALLESMPDVLSLRTTVGNTKQQIEQVHGIAKCKHEDGAASGDYFITAYNEMRKCLQNLSAAVWRHESTSSRTSMTYLGF